MQTARAIFSMAYPFHYDFTASAEGQLVVDKGSLLSYANGAFSPDQFFDAFEIASVAAEKLAKFYRLSLTKSLAMAS